MDQQPTGGLPENAFRELREGESYAPVISDEQRVTEVSLRSILIGLVMTVIFSAAAAFIALKTGQGIEAMIPIAIIAVGLSAFLKTTLGRASTMLENINVLAISVTSGATVGGMVFVIPALWILGLEKQTSFFQIFLIGVLGTVLGILLLIPFRRYFVAEMHGKFPFPEATAITEILVAGEKGGSGAKVLIYWLGLGFVYDILILVFEAWREIVTTAKFALFDGLTNRIKAVTNLDAMAALAGLGMIIGIRYAGIILSGSLLSWWVLVPLCNWFGAYIDVPISASGRVLQPGEMELIRNMPADDIFYEYVRFIGIGGIFTAGFIGILKLWKVIWQAMTVGMKGLFGSIAHAADTAGDRRTDSDIEMSKVMLMLIGVALAVFAYYYFVVLVDQPGALSKSLVALGVVLLISFLFSAVSAWAIAMISVTPISGMTLTTLIITGVVLYKMQLVGTYGMLAAILIGGVVCTALSMAGSMVSEFKISYWLGATPRKVEWSSILGAFLAAIVTSLVIILLAKTFGYVESEATPKPLPAPQANAMAAVIKGLLTTGDAPWLLYGLGAAVAVMIEFVGVSSLAFALGMYLPIELNTPIFLGALVVWYAKKIAKNEADAQARGEKANLVARGLIAGGGLAGIVAAFILLARTQFDGFDRLMQSLTLGFTDTGGNVVSLMLFLILLGWIFWDVRRAKEG
ncbi:MAG: oligopeptide transporter, OPT family [Acidobacteriota bacterium]|nr:MAG: oligopeptide transporter, OPT family [Acidobacteriota bacterium]